MGTRCSGLKNDQSHLYDVGGASTAQPLPFFKYCFWMSVSNVFLFHKEGGKVAIEMAMIIVYTDNQP